MLFYLFVSIVASFLIIGISSLFYAINYMKKQKTHPTKPCCIKIRVK